MSQATDNAIERSLPCDTDSEKIALACCMRDNDPTGITETRAVLTANDFFIEKHRIIFRAICSLFDAGDKIGMSSVAQELMRTKQIDAVGGLAGLIEFDQGLMFLLDQTLRRIRDLSARRRMIQAAQVVIFDSCDQTIPVTQVLSSWSEKTKDSVAESTSAETIGDIVDEAGGLQELLAKRYGIETPWTEYNVATCGFQKTDLIVVGARPSMGKTAWMLNSAYHAAQNGKRCAVYTYETGKQGLLLRLISTRTRIPYLVLTSGEFSKADRMVIAREYDRLAEIPLRIMEFGSKTSLAVRCHADKLNRKTGLDIAFLDYLQRMPGAGSSSRMENRNQEIGRICRDIKDCAMELKIPFVLLSQLNRALNARVDKRPMMSDLRESGDIEQDADVINFIHRPEYYDREKPELKGLAELIIAKQRNGDTPIIELIWLKEHGAFVERAYDREAA